ncbi:hypothetical protein EDC01DRAFT_155952 [Geopyxis carbonaria]|nr:hypothetical protein EDC01DRAFT_155952 [Geopyxis carbonaria]
MDPQQQQQQADGYAGSSDGSSSSQQQQQQQKPESEAAPATDKDKKEDGPPGTLRVRASRKRTKTGCLTCRKRRIKCGEERPTCNNCIKSKRVCEGYNQRVVFKDGMNGLLRPGSMAGGERRFAAQPYPNLQPALAPQPQYAHQNGEIIPRDTNLPAHIREHYARRESEPGYSQNHLNVTVPLGPLPLPSPHHPDGSFNGDFGGYQDSPREEHQQYASYYGQPTPTSATASSFNIQPNGPSSAPNSASLFGPRTPFTPTHPPHDFNTPPQSAFGPGPSNTSAGSPSTSCPFNPPLDSKYAMASQGNQSEYNNNMFDPSNTLPRLTSSSRR